MNPVRLSLLATSDVHGAFFPYDFIKGSRCGGSLSRVHRYVEQLRDAVSPDNVMLFDVGDMLLGSPCCTVANDGSRNGMPHAAADIIRYMRYDAIAPGNHDLETGHEIYDTIAREISPVAVVCANALHDSDGTAWFSESKIFERNGLRIAVTGFVTTAISRWIEPSQVSGIRFTDILSQARETIGHIRSYHSPDIVVVLLHSGAEGGGLCGIPENVAYDFVRTIEGVDVLFYGHDHKQFADIMTGPDGRNVAVVNPGSGAFAVGRIDLTVDDSGIIALTPEIADLTSTTISAPYLSAFSGFCRRVHREVERHVAFTTQRYDAQSALDTAGSPYMDLLHGLQLRITEADCSIAAATSLTANFGPGVMTVADLYSLYRFDNKLCVVRLTGHELHRYMEYSADMLVRRNAGENIPVYNIDTLSGVQHTLHLEAPLGQRIEFDEGFSEDTTYDVCMNTYRAYGGGDHLIQGAGISPDELPSRIVRVTPRNFREMILELLCP